MLLPLFLERSLNLFINKLLLLGLLNFRPFGSDVKLLLPCLLERVIFVAQRMLTLYQINQLLRVCEWFLEEFEVFTAEIVQRDDGARLSRRPLAELFAWIRGTGSARRLNCDRGNGRFRNNAILAGLC